MRLCNSGENARSYIGVTSRTYIPARPMSNFSFTPSHIFQFRFWPHRRNWQVILCQHATFHQYRITHVGDMTSYRFLRWWPLWRNFTSVSDWATSLSSEGQCLSAYHIVKITQSMAEMYLFPFCKNKRPPYWNSTSGLDIDRFVVICMFFCIRLSNFVQVGAPVAKIWRHIHLSRWRPRPINTTSDFVFVDVNHSLRKVKVYQQTKFRRLRYNYFRIGKTNVHRIGIRIGEHPKI